MTTSVTPIAATRLLKTEPYEASRSRRRKLGSVSHGNASITCCESHAAVRMLRNIEPHNPSATVS